MDDCLRRAGEAVHGAKVLGSMKAYNLSSYDEKHMILKSQRNSHGWKMKWEDALGRLAESERGGRRAPMIRSMSTRDVRVRLGGLSVIQVWG